MQEIQAKTKALIAEINNKSVIVTAASKYASIPQIIAAHQAGITHFGENHLQTAQTKISALSELSINWHYIGALQSNKIKKITSLFNWIDSVTNIKQAILINNSALNNQIINICIQVKINSEESRTACCIDNCEKLIQNISKLGNLKLKGLMYLPEKDLTARHLEHQYQVINSYFTQIKQTYNLDILSMGMSNDYKIAIKNGSNMVRIGKKIFKSY